MAYMRDDHYVWSDSEFMHMDHYAMPLGVFDELVVMHWHRLTPEQRDAAAARCVEKYDGNFGMDGLNSALGRPSVMEQAMSERQQLDGGK